MQVSRVFFGLQCDGCGRMLKNENGGDYYICDAKSLNLLARELSGWLITHDHRHYCPNCHHVNDNDMIQTIDNRLYDF